MSFHLVTKISCHSLDFLRSLSISLTDYSQFLNISDSNETQIRLECDSNATQMRLIFDFYVILIYICIFGSTLLLLIIFSRCFRSSLDELYVKHVRWRRFSVILWWKKVFQSVHPSFYSILQRRSTINLLNILQFAGFFDTEKSGLHLDALTCLKSQLYKASLFFEILSFGTSRFVRGYKTCVYRLEMRF